jgi:hypothetical protein
MYVENTEGFFKDWYLTKLRLKIQVTPLRKHSHLRHENQSFNDM